MKKSDRTARREKRRIRKRRKQKYLRRRKPRRQGSRYRRGKRLPILQAYHENRVSAGITF